MDKGLFEPKIKRVKCVLSEDLVKPTRKTKRSRTIAGVGINDSNYQIAVNVDSITYICVFYVTWKAVITRVYRYDKNRPQSSYYHKVKVCDEWLKFSNFRLWMEKQDYEGKFIDKDILVPGNRIYAPDRCIFVTLEMNNLLTADKTGYSDLPVGVSRHRDKYQSQIKMNGKNVHLGKFNDPQLAHEVYVDVRVKYMRDKADAYGCPRVRAGIYQHAAILETSIQNRAT